MMKRFLIVVCSLFMAGFASAQPAIERVAFPSQVKAEYRGVPDADIQGKVWNRWTSKNFVVCSLNDTQAQFLNGNLEKVKSWGLTRWGLTDVNFVNECRLICVDEAVLYKKLFGLDGTKVEVRKVDGKTKMNVIFLLLNDAPSKTLPTPVMHVALMEWEQQNNVKLPWWAVRGMSLLNGDLGSIRKNIADLQPTLKANGQLFGSKGLMNMNEESYLKETPEKRALFDNQSVALCLLLRKEFGQDKFLASIKEGDPLKGLGVFGFQSYEQFDKSFIRYMIDLSNDVTEVNKKKTPDSYLQIKAK
jgi:hypothetical protein